MKISAVDSKRNLFYVQDAYPDELLNSFLSTEHDAIAWQREEMQQQYPRRRLIVDKNSIYAALDNYIKSHCEYISDCVNLNILSCDTVFWLDMAGFSMQPHIDNGGVFAAMQIFLNNNEPNLGTTFYNPDSSVRFNPQYVVNTGYFMINDTDQLHGMQVPVPQNSYRVCSYTWFYPKT